MQQALRQPGAVDSALGEWLTEPKPQVWFDVPSGAGSCQSGVRADRRTRLAYDTNFFFINGESYRYAGRDADVLRQLADRRELGALECRRLGRSARDLLSEWLAAGWLHPEGGLDDA